MHEPVDNIIRMHLSLDNSKLYRLGSKKNQCQTFQEARPSNWVGLYMTGQRGTN